MVTTIQSSASVAVMRVPKNHGKAESMRAALEDQVPPVSPVTDYQQDTVERLQTL